MNETKRERYIRILSGLGGADISAEACKELVELLKEQPERPNGHWVEIGDEPYDEWECDRCGFVIDGSGCIDPEEYRDIYIYCPHCGSYNGGEEE